MRRSQQNEMHSDFFPYREVRWIENASKNHKSIYLKEMKKRNIEVLMLSI